MDNENYPNETNEGLKLDLEKNMNGDIKNINILSSNEVKNSEKITILVPNQVGLNGNLNNKLKRTNSFKTDRLVT
jgi:hypothetical protein